MDVPKNFLIKSDTLRKILMNRGLGDVDKLRFILNGLNSGDFTNDTRATSESNQVKPQLLQQQPDNSDTTVTLQQPPVHELLESAKEGYNDILIEGPEHKKITVDESLINKVISSLPKSQRKHGRTVIQLMAGDPRRIWFNTNFELVRKGVTVELTNISDLLRDLLQR
jgi:hypothetical protein